METSNNDIINTKSSSLQLYEELINLIKTHNMNTQTNALALIKIKYNMDISKEEQNNYIKTQEEIIKRNRKQQLLYTQLIQNIHQDTDKTLDKIIQSLKQEEQKHINDLDTLTNYQTTLTDDEILEIISKDYFIMPELHETARTDENLEELLNPRNLKICCYEYSHETKSDSIISFWKRILIYTKNAKLNEKHYIHILQTLTKGKANQVLNEAIKSNMELKSIIEALYVNFIDRDKEIKQIKAIHDFKRRKNEDIYNAMHRARILIYRMKDIYKEKAQEKLYINDMNTLLKQKLLNCVKDDIKKELECMWLEHNLTGKPLSLQASLDFIHNKETEQKFKKKIRKYENKQSKEIDPTKQNNIKINNIRYKQNYTQYYHGDNHQYKQYQKYNHQYRQNYNQNYKHYQHQYKQNYRHTNNYNKNNYQYHNEQYYVNNRERRYNPYRYNYRYNNNQYHTHHYRENHSRQNQNQRYGRYKHNYKRHNYYTNYTDNGLKKHKNINNLKFSDNFTLENLTHISRRITPINKEKEIQKEQLKNLNITPVIHAIIGSIYKDNPKMTIGADVLIDNTMPISIIDKTFFDYSVEKLYGNKIIQEHKHEIHNINGNDILKTSGESTVRLWITKEKYMDIDVYVAENLGMKMILGHNFLLHDSVKHISNENIIIRGKPDIRIPLYESTQKLKEANKQREKLNKKETQRIIKYSSLKVLTTTLNKHTIHRPLQPINTGLYSTKKTIHRETQTTIPKQNEINTRKHEQNKKSISIGCQTDIPKQKEIATNKQEKLMKKTSTQTQTDIWNYTTKLNEIDRQRQEDINIKIITKRNTRYNRDMLKPKYTKKITHQNNIKQQPFKNNKEEENKQQCLFCEESKPYKWIEPHNIKVHEADEKQIQEDDINTLHIVIPQNYNKELIKTCKKHEHLTKTDKIHTKLKNTQQKFRQQKPKIEKDTILRTNHTKTQQAQIEDIKNALKNTKENTKPKKPKNPHIKEMFDPKSHMNISHAKTLLPITNIWIKDNYLNEKEKEDEIKNYNTYGYYQPTITNYTEEKKSITELNKINDETFNNVELIDMFDIDHLPIQHQNRIKTMLFFNTKSFSSHRYDIGKTNSVEMNIDLIEDKLPKMQKYTPLPLGVRDDVKEILNQLLEYEIIRECHEPSPYCSNLITEENETKRKLSIMYDGRALNYDSKQVKSVPTADIEKLQKLYERKHITSIKLNDIFLQIPLKEEDQKLTSFYAHTHGMRMCFTRCPESLANSNIFLRQLIDKLFANMQNSTIQMGNELIIATDEDIEKHCEELEQIFKIFRNANIKIRPQNINICKQNIEFLGMVFKDKDIMKHGCSEALDKLPSPTTPNNLKAIIKCLQTYEHIIPNYEYKIKSLTELSTQHHKTYIWTNEHELSLRSIIYDITSKIKTFKPNMAKTMYITTDASGYCAGGRLYQLDENEKEQLIATVSRTFSKAERHYSIFKKEILALLYTLKTCDYFIRYAKKIVINVDAKSILYLRLAKECSGILMKFSIELSKYNSDIYHIPGEQNIVSDVLSRQHKDIDNMKEYDEQTATIEEKRIINLIDMINIEEGISLEQIITDTLIEGNSPMIKTNKKAPKSKAIGGKRLIKNVPQQLGRKKLNLPKTTKYRPGMKLPEKYMKSNDYYSRYRH